ncbi:MAG TPA: RES family NAD+ phosphorylase [Hymenobacter sp.]|jgi:RES domain-containing protein
MLAFRLGRAEYITDLSGQGAQRYGGRWNNPGTAVLYLAESRALVVLEVLVNLPANATPTDLQLLTLELPAHYSQETVEVAALPADWQAYPHAAVTITWGSRWVEEQRTLVLRVPSVLVPQEFNLLLNPAHPDFRKVRRVGEPEPFQLDERLRKG